jgi:nucleoside-diphosphate-sugar epimerase
MSIVLLTGGGGYIGTVLAECLLRAGHEVRVFDRFFFGRELFGALLSDPRLELVRGDVRSIEPQVFRNVSAVFDLAAISNDPACDLDANVTEDINLHGALRVARMAREAGVARFVFSSSCSVYGHGEQTHITEESPTHPVSLYARMKVRAERDILELADERFSVTVLRNATVYGLSYRMRFDLVVNLMTLTAFKSGKIFVLGGGKQWRPLVHVRDVARAFELVLESPPDWVNGRTFNVGSSEQNYQVWALANMVRDVVPGVEIETVPDDADKRTYNVSFDAFRERLGFVPKHDVASGVEEIYDALKRGSVEDDIRTRTVGYYKYLLEAERILREVSLQGRIF